MWELGEKLKLKLQISKSWIVDVMTSVKRRGGKLCLYGKSIKRGMMMRTGGIYWSCKEEYEKNLHIKKQRWQQNKSEEINHFTNRKM
jgi:hypothetical protein